MVILCLKTTTQGKSLLVGSFTLPMDLAPVSGVILMAQHFLKSARVRDLTPMHISCKSEEECYEYFKEMKWGSNGTQICSHCGAIDRHYHRKSRRQWRCKHCDGYFSVTTGTPFQDRKLSFKQILIGMMNFVSSASGISFHKFSLEINVQVKTAQVFYGKLREVICKSMDDDFTVKMSGLVQIDGGYFGGRPRHGRLRRKSNPVEMADYVNAKLRGEKPAKRKPRNKVDAANWHRRQNRRVIMVIRECFQEKGFGGIRTRVEICHSENEIQATQMALAYIEPGTHIMTDDCPAYNALSTYFFHESVPHAEMFSTPEGVNDNQAESYFSRARRHVKGVALRSSLKYLYDMANEMAWREDTRRWTLRERFEWLMKKIFTHGLSRWWCGYWQGYMREGEVLWKDRAKKFGF